MANRRSANLPAPAQQPKIMVAVDFGTTFSGLAWANTESPDHHYVVKSWGDDLPEGEKAPTVIRYQPGSRKDFEWGFQVTDNPRPGVKYHEWFKLGLCPEFEIRRQHDSNLPRLYKSTTALPTGNKAECKALVITYLKCLNKRLKVALGTALARLPREYIITVPAIWTHGAQELTRECAQKAGMGEGDKIEIISEPEAASIFAIQKMVDLKLEKNDTFVLCDAGGGTVDLASFTIENRTPYINLAGAGGGGSGGLCGSSFLNRIFDNYLRAKLRGYSPWTDRLHNMVLKEFENRKKTFAGTKAFKFHVEGHHSDNPRHGISDSLLEISAAEIQSEVFMPVIEEIKTLVRNQIRKTEEDGTQVKAVLLAGGFGENPFLLKQLKEMVRDGITVRPVEHNNTAIVRGALIAGLAGQLGPRKSFNVRVSARPASYHYGIQCFEQYVPSEHPDAKGLIEDDGLGDKQIYINQWMVDKGKLIAEDKPKQFKYEYVDKHHKRVPDFLPFKIYTCDTDPRPTYAKQLDGNQLRPREDVYELVEIPIPLGQTKAINRQVEVRNGTKVTVIPFRVEMKLKKARLIFTIFLGGVEPQQLEPKDVRFESSNDLVQNDGTEGEDE